MKVVISYKNADLDGVASAVGYSEYLNMIGEEASYYLNGSYQKEVDLLCSMFQINLSNLLDNLDNSSIIDGYHIIYCPFSDTKNILMRYGRSFYDDMFFEDKLVLKKDIKKNLRDNTKK